MNPDIRDQIDRSFGNGPPVDDDDVLVRARGHLRRRRQTEAVSALAVALVVVISRRLQRKRVQGFASAGLAVGAHAPAIRRLPYVSPGAGDRDERLHDQ